MSPGHRDQIKKKLKEKKTTYICFYQSIIILNINVLKCNIIYEIFHQSKRISNYFH